ncbi:MAG: hypothetical protein A4E58_01576 [Syntrophorhabdus sp. PtaB.Bin006]|nr:MAG: hypothetical protein A4E58_01576 [Syntrophorhabdus sp. PtaB.Bin006]
MVFGVFGRRRHLFQVVEGDGPRTPPLHLFEVVAAFDVPHKEEAFEGLYVRTGGDHVNGNGDARVVIVPEPGKRAFGIVAAIGDLLTEAVFFTELFPDDLDDIVSVAVGLGEY